MAKLGYGGCNVPRGWKYKYGGWNRPHWIVYTLLVAVKVYVVKVDGTSLRWLK